MWFALAERHEIAVGARHRERLPHDELDVALGHVERHQAAFAFEQHLHRCLFRGLAHRLRDLRERLAFEGWIRRVARDDQLVWSPSPLEASPNIGREPIVLRPLDALQQLRPAADLRPSWNQRADNAGAARLVRVLVGVHFDAAIARLFDLLDERHREAPAPRPERFHVGNDAGQAAFFGNANHFLHGGDDADAVVRLVADVAFVDAAKLADDLRQRDHLLGFRVAARCVVKAR